jgi:hypothetical protein
LKDFRIFHLMGRNLPEVLQSVLARRYEVTSRRTAARIRRQPHPGQKFAKDQTFVIPVYLLIAKSLPSGEGMAHSRESLLRHC